MAAKILLVDGDSRFRELLAGLLRARKHEVYEAGGGEAGDAALREVAPELVIVDASLPDTDGLQWISRLRARGNDVPLVLVSSLWREPLSSRRLVDELRVMRVIHKPIIPGDFAEIVDSELDRLVRISGPVREQAAPTTDRESEFAQTLEELREKYRAELPRRLTELRSLLDLAQDHPGDFRAIGEVRELAHQLRGTAGSYGFLQVGEEAGRIEGLAMAALEQGALSDSALRAASQALDLAEQGIQAVPHSFHAPFNALARVLVVDDDLRFLALIREMGRSQLVDVIGVPSAAEAVRVAKSGRIDAAILDAHLAPGEDAYELGRALRALPGKENLPFSIVSVDAGMENRVAAAHSGASLFLTKPLSSQQLESAIRQMMAQRRRGLPQILIVDDDPDFASHLQGLLEAERMAVHTVHDVPAMLERLTESRPDLLLLDMELPGMSGMDACRLVRMTPDMQDLPILFLTAHTEISARIEAFEAGADDYLAKPVIPQEILTRVRLRLERNRLLKERSDRDPLTGLLTRRALFEVLPARCAEARRHGRPITIALLDLDHFKKVNDAHGHLVGDRVLMRLGRLLAARFRAEDLRGRWGGEEFLLAFPGETPETVTAVLGRVLEEFSQVPFFDESGKTRFSCSFSVGIAGAPEDGSSTEALIQAADRRLYVAKRSGRGRVVSAG
ncbi:response regulator [Vulgatibacter incomptus]|uniref:Uncharacterized protein n=1 Tax=Vulgatibacter incomptus TaxID=1391653 RepID=A0A0K1PG05_9BACT|nr:response regulator [Vulgatibacter incomptus]AKU92044.1 hypothetical protein AKJ08_2431 [Vulgatibacter incomptus]